MESLHQSLLDYECEEELGELTNLSKKLLEKSHLGMALRTRFSSDLDSFVRDYSYLLSKTKSPIEKQFIEVLSIVAPKYGLPVCAGDSYDQKEDTMFCPVAEPRSLNVFPQFELNLEKKYVVDFLLVTEERSNPEKVRKLIIECDGHDFHEKTKEQAKKDKSRDRDLTANGFPVFRFTGSEVHNNALACAEQTALFLCRYHHG